MKTYQRLHKGLLSGFSTASAMALSSPRISSGSNAKESLEMLHRGLMKKNKFKHGVVPVR